MSKNAYNAKAYQYTVDTRDTSPMGRYKLGCLLNETDHVVYGPDFYGNITVDCANPRIYTPKRGPTLTSYKFAGENWTTSTPNSLRIADYIVAPHRTCKFDKCQFRQRIRNAFLPANAAFLSIPNGTHETNYTVQYDNSRGHPYDLYYAVGCGLRAAPSTEVQSLPFLAGNIENRSETVSNFTWRFHVNYDLCATANLSTMNISMQSCSRDLTDESGRLNYKNDTNQVELENRWSYNVKYKFLYLADSGLRLDYANANSTTVEVAGTNYT